MKRPVFILAACAVLAVVFWFFPPFHVVSLKQAQAEKTKGAFNAADFASEFWRTRLTPALKQAADAQTVLDALTKDAKAAATTYGRTVGISDTCYYFIRGTGMVVSVETKGIGLALQGSDGKPDLLIKTGLLSGNTVRDATGLLSASEFPNSQNFNDISTELNRIVESQVIPNLKTNATTGRKLAFTVCAEIVEDEAGDRPLKVIPLQADLQ